MRIKAGSPAAYAHPLKSWSFDGKEHSIFPDPRIEESMAIQWFMVETAFLQDKTQLIDIML
jgi:hypothetical protein